jgi:hypothetical protein
VFGVACDVAWIASHGHAFARWMYMEIRHGRLHDCRRGLTAVLCAVCLAPGDARANIPSRTLISAQSAAVSGDTVERIPADQLDSLVAPIALYPDPLLAQTLAASTYPLELMQLQQWLTKNAALKDRALADAAARQPWDPSVQAMAALPDIVKRLADDIQWTTDLGNAFLAQQSDVMEAVQRMRRKAQDKGTLASSEQQAVKTEVIENKTVVVIEQPSPDVVYVPSYDPTVIWGAPVYPYPPISYPPPGYYAAGAAISFGVGVAVGAAWRGGGWGWNAGWGHNNITINNNNNFNRNANINGGGNLNRGGNWQHNPQHRGGAPYRDRTTAQQFGGAARGDSLANRQAGARQQIDRQGGNLRSNPVGTSGLGDRSGGGFSGRSGSGDRIGQRDLSGGGGRENAFGGGGFSGDRARASSNRGSSSMGSRGGGASRGGGGGGARRGGGGGGRRR